MINHCLEMTILRIYPVVIYRYAPIYVSWKCFVSVEHRDKPRKGNPSEIMGSPVRPLSRGDPFRADP